MSLAELFSQTIINISKYTIIDPHEHFVDIIALLSLPTVFTIYQLGYQGSPLEEIVCFFCLFLFSGKGYMTGTSLEVLKIRIGRNIFYLT